MVVFFIILAILFFISLTFLVLCLSSVEIEINDLVVDTNKQKYHKVQNYLFYIRLKLFNTITWLKIKIDKEKIKNIQNSKIFNSKIFNKIKEYEHIIEILLKNKKEILQKKNIKYIKEINPELKKLKLYLQLCTSDNILTAFSVSLIASVISIILAKNVEEFRKDKYKYVITPKYEEKPSIKIKLNCIISIKIVHIMNVIYMLIKKRSVDYDERTSDRRAYVCSND